MVNVLKIIMRNYIELSSTDLWFLFYLNAPSIIVGFSNPVRGYLKKDLEEFKVMKRKKLIKKNVLQETSNGLSITNKYNEFITDISNSEHVALVSKKQEKEVKTLSLHFTEKRIAKLTQIDTGTYQIELLENFSDVVENLTYDLPEDNLYSIPSIVQKTKLLEKIRNAESNPGLIDIKEKIDKWGLEEIAAGVLTDLFIKPSTALSFLMYRNKNKPKYMSFDGFALLADDENAVIIEPIGKDDSQSKIRFIKRQGVRNKITSIFGKVS